MERKVLTSALRPGSECLSIEQLGRYADGALPFAEREAAASHVNRCANCQAELALLHAFTTALIRDDEQPIVRPGVETLRRREAEIFGTPRGVDVDRADRRATSPFAAFRTMLSAAAVVLALVGGYYLLAPRAPAIPGAGPGGPGGEVTRALAVSVQGPVGDQPSAPQRFSWNAVSSATTYRLELLEVDRRQLWSTETAATGMDVPDEVRALMTPGKTLMWRVIAIDAAGRSIAQSDLQRFRVIRS